MHFISKEKQVFLISFCLIFPRFPWIWKNRLNTSLIYTKWTFTAATTEFVCNIPNRKKISNEHFILCEAGISLDEMIKSINSETNNKPPGNDGLYRYITSNSPQNESKTNDPCG